MEKQLLNDIEAAGLLDLSASYMRQMRCRGQGPTFIKLGKAVKYRVQDLESWIEQNVRQNTLEG